MKRSFSETIELLVNARQDWRKKDGKVNVTKAARDIGISQPTLKRMIDGGSGKPELHNAEIMMKSLGVTYGQLMGSEPIPWIDGDQKSDTLDRIEIVKLMADFNPEAMKRLKLAAKLIKAEDSAESL